MQYKTVGMSDIYPEVSLTSYCPDMTAELKLPPRRTVIVFPGGGYHFLSDREAEPIVFQFMAAGFNVFLLRYSVHPRVLGWNPLTEASRAVKYVREHAAEYNTDPDHIFVCGFSAGGHLAASAGTLWNIPEVREALGIDGEKVPEGINRPTGTILSYPVITAGPFAHKGSFKNLSGHDELTDEDIEKYSLELHVDSSTSPAFMWHTFTDKTVPVQNSLLYASALAAAGVPFELHIYPEGHHGLALCNEFTMSANQANIVPHAEGWIGLAIKWVRDFK